MAKKWGALQSNRHMMRMAGAKQKLEEFRAERIKYVADVLEVRYLGYHMVIPTDGDDCQL